MGFDRVLGSAMLELDGAEVSPELFVFRVHRLLIIIIFFLSERTRRFAKRLIENSTKR